MPPKKITTGKSLDPLLDAAELLRQAEMKRIELKKKTGPLPATESDTRRLVHELQVHQIGLEMQNEELARSRAEVEALLRQYTDLYDFAPVGYFTLARDGAIHQVNLAGANLLGVERSELIKRRFGVFVSVESRPAFSAFLERVFSTSGSKETCEVALLKDGSAPRWAHMEASTEDKQECRAVVVDITERKRAEEALHETNEYLENLLNYANAPIIVWDPQFKITRFNHAFETVTGRCAQEVLGKPLEILFPPAQINASMKLIQKTLTGERWEVVEINIQHVDGSIRTVLWNSATLFSADGTTPIATIAQGQDITARKKAEETLRLRVEQLSALSQASQAVTTSLDLDQVLMEIMSLAGKVVGSEYTSIVLVDEAGHISGSVENIPGVLSIERRARKRGFTSWILRARRPAVVDEIGEVGVIRLSVGEGAPRTANPHLVAKGIKSFVGLPLIVEDHVLGVLYLHSLRPGTFHDQLTLLTTFASQAAIAIEKARLYNAVQKELAERKQAEEALQRERDTAQQYLDIAGVLMAALDTDGQITLINQKGCEIFGYKESELIGRNWFDTCLSEDAREEVRGVIERLMAGDVESMEYYENAVLTKNGEQRILAFHNAVIRNQASQITGILFSGDDITEHKQAEEALRTSEAQLSTAMKIARLGYWEYDVTRDQFSFDDQFYSLLHTTAEREGGYSMSSAHYAQKFVYPDDMDVVGTEIQKAVQTNNPDYHSTLDHRIICADGEINYVTVHIRVEKDAQGRTVKTHGVNQDITERKRAEEALAHERNLLRSLIDNVPDYIYVKDTESRNVLANMASARRTGLSTPEDMLGKTDFDYFPQELAARYFADDQEVIRSGQPLLQHEEPTIDAAGNLQWISTNKVPLRDDQGKIYGLVGMGRDITERKQAEEALRESERELKEAQLLGRVGNWEYDIENQKITWSAQVYRLYERNPVLGPPTVEEEAAYYSPEQAQMLHEYARRAVEEGQEFEYDLEATLPSGKRVYFSAKMQPVKDARGWIVKLFGTVQDITERKRAEEALAKERSLLRALTDNIPDGIYFKDLESRFLLINHAQARGFGLSDPAQAIGKTDFDFFTEEHARPAYENERAIMQSGQPVVSKEEKETWPDGRVGWVSTTKMPLRDEKGNIIGTFGISRDITERKQAEEKLARQTEELRRRNEELARLYRASGSLISGTLLRYQDLAQTIVEIVQQEFGQSNCSLLVVQKDSNELVRLVASGLYAERVKYQNLALDGLGLIPLAIRTNKVVNVGDVHSAPDYVQGWEAAQSELAIPLKVGSDVIGAIDVQSSEPNAFSPDDARLMMVFSERAALALEHSRLNAQTEARLQQLTALRTVDMAISGSFDINLTLGVLLDQLTGQLRVHAADVLIFNATTQMFKFACERGFRTQMLQRTQLKFGAGYAWRAIRERRVIVVPDIQVEPDGLQRSPDLSGEQFVAYLGMPLIAKGQIKGVLEVFHREPLDLEKEGYGFLEMLAGQAAIAIDNAELFDHLQRSNADLTMAYDSTLEGWASALELRDKYTEGHTRRVTMLTTQLARALGVKKDDMVHIYRGALLHDIGKVGVPDSIVLKPGPLTADEWVIMRKHPQYAYDMLSPIAYLRLALDIPYCHHEKWDGTGYPRGQKGEQIPLAARIFAVVDVYDALTSDRPYRKAWTREKTISHIREQAGSHFDPEVVKVFLNELKNEK